MSSTNTTQRARRGAALVMATFALNGFTLANWLSRIPTVRDELGLSEGQLGMIILVGSLGSLLSMPVTGRVIDGLGARRTVALTAVVAAVGLTVVAAGVHAGTVWLLVAGLFVTFMGVGGWDVSMNYAGTMVERGLERAIMPWFHGGFSIGTVLGAGVGALVIRAGVGVPLHVVTVVAVALTLVLLCTRGFLTADDLAAGENGGEPDEEVRGARASFTGVWFERRTLLVGLVVLAAALTEGAANDWLALAVVDGFDAPNEVGAIGLAIFLLGMTAMRFLGTALLNRFGRVVVLRLCTAMAIAGLAIFTLVPVMPVAMAGGALWGMGAALGFPVGMSAASDDPAKAAARLAVVSTIGYAAFLVGPGVLGLLGEIVGTRHALLVIMVPLVAGLLAIPAARELPPASAAPRTEDSRAGGRAEA
ncbi:MFS transporter [Ruania suaedae]|uniref:MFS transporter n=1 Tax=Ruania suaedae TaxID=2897774 RepID=UPI001E2BCE2E|nr:MFS transporter [Ruania suaedae]UFU02457.1 MFS transporter [Ruania suaedae]